MKCYALICELYFPQNLCHWHTDIQTFSKNSQIMLRTSKTSIFTKNQKLKSFTKIRGKGAKADAGVNVGTLPKVPIGHA